MIGQFEYRNGRYQGQTKEWMRHGQGMFLDDRSNLVLSDWYYDKINGNTFIVLGREFIYSYGIWTEGKPNGINTVEYDGLKMIAQYNMGRISSTVLIVDQKNGLIYLLDNQNRFTDDFKVANRMELNLSRLSDLKGLLGLAYSLEAESLSSFLERIVGSQHPGRLFGLVFEFESGKSYLGFKKCERRFGIGARFSETMQPIEFGVYNDQAELEGPCSIYRDGSMEEAYGHNGIMQIAKEGQKKTKEHLHSLNMLNYSVYFQSIKRLKSTFAAVVRTVTRFQKTFNQKESPQTNSDSLRSPQKNSQLLEKPLAIEMARTESERSEDMMYSSKYNEASKRNDKAEFTNASNKQDEINTTSPSRKPGFIRSHEKSMTASVSVHGSLPRQENQQILQSDFQQPAQLTLNKAVSAAKQQMFEYFKKEEKLVHIRHAFRIADNSRSPHKVSVRTRSRSPANVTQHPKTANVSNSPPQLRWRQ